jgi:hypothetical protein
MTPPYMDYWMNGALLGIKMRIPKTLRIPERGDIKVPLIIDILCFIVISTPITKEKFTKLTGVSLKNY